jgi:coenzyme F420-dependent oxidoreductase
MSKIGIVAPYWSDITMEELIEYAQLAEELGYDSIWVPEMWGRDAFSLIGLLAANTEKIKLGTGIISVFSRTPAMIAQTAATLDEISGGRIMLGLGTSGPIVIENWHGIKYEKPIQRTREYIEIIKMALRFERVNYEGEIFKLRNFKLQFKPVRSDIPILIAAMGPKNIHLAGEAADGWIPFLVPIIEGLVDAKEHLIEGAQSAGRDSGDIKICPYIVSAVSGDEESSKRALQEHIAYYVGGMGTYYYNTVSRYGFENEASQILEAWKAGDKKKAIDCVSDTMLDSLSIWGTPGHGKATIKKYLAQDVDTPILLFPPKASRNMVRDTIEGLSPLG